MCQETMESIAERTTTEAMAVGDRFDPVTYGEGGGLSKVNLEPHKYSISDDKLTKYQTRFEDRFRDAGICSFADFATAIRQLYTERVREVASDIA